jgi:hypothetical protein
MSGVIPNSRLVVETYVFGHLERTKERNFLKPVGALRPASPGYLQAK